MTADQPQPLCTAAWWDGTTAPLHCSLPAHKRGQHAAHRMHNTSNIPPIRTWPYSRDDQPAYEKYEQEVQALAALPPTELDNLQNVNIVNTGRALTGKGDIEDLPALKAERAKIDDAIGRQIFR